METLVQVISRLLASEVINLTSKLRVLETEKQGLVARRAEIRQELDSLEIRIIAANANIDSIKLLIDDAKKEVRKNV